MRGKFITFEGCDGSGKTTQASLLANALKNRNISVYNTKEPGGTKLSDVIRGVLLKSEIDDPVTEMLLISAARREHIKLIKSMLIRGIWVISDRYTDSSLAYQGGGKGADAQLIDSIMQVSHEKLAPDVTFLLDIGVEEAQTRMSASDKHNTFYDNKSIGFHRKVRSAFLEIQKSEPNRIYKIDGSGDSESTHESIVKIVSDKFLKDDLP